VNPIKHAFDPKEVMAYLDGELEPQRAVALAAHLDQCGDCQGLAREFRLVSERLLNFQVEPAPAGIERAVLGMLQEGQRAKLPRPDYAARKFRFWQRPYVKYLGFALAGGTAVALIIAASVPQLMQSRSGSAQVASRDLAYYVAHKSAGNAASALSSARRSYELQSTSVAMQAGEEEPAQSPGLEAPEVSGPMIIGTASLNITAANYDEASKAIEQLAVSRGGYVEKLNAKAPAGSSREVEATLRVPAKELDALLADLRKLGRVEEESRSNTEVTSQYVDLEARLRSARTAEQRLLQLLAARTGKLSDVLEAERELARVRGEIESMQGQRTALLHQVNYASVQVRLGEEYRETLHARPVRTGNKIWNALIEGVSNLEEGVVGLLLFFLSYGPSIVFWLAIIAIPAWLAWRRLRSRRATEAKSYAP
jgi:anti-sigma factor RsiW